MKKIFILPFLILVFGPLLYAQVQIQTTIPATGLLQKNQLWNLVLVNSSTSKLEGRLELILTDRQTAQEIMTASTAAINLGTGAVMLNVARLNPVSYNYTGIEPDNNFNSLLPAGSYTACYNFVQDATSTKRIILAEECINFDIEALSPPMLNFPADSSILETAPLQFSWLPPAPAGLFPQVRYEFILTEIQPTQQAAEAIESNLPLFSSSIMRTNFLGYSGALPAIEKDKWYAWQVIARDQKNYAGKSEVWVFKINKQAPAQAAIDGSAYIQLQKNGAAKTIAHNGTLRFHYVNQLGDKEVMLTVADLTDQQNKAKDKTRLPVIRGENYFQQDLSKLIRLEEGHLYMLTLTNSAGELWNILFENKKYRDQ